VANLYPQGISTPWTTPALPGTLTHRPHDFRR
jgi:hypothetical protein